MRRSSALLEAARPREAGTVRVPRPDDGRRGGRPAGRARRRGQGARRRAEPDPDARPAAGGLRPPRRHRAASTSCAGSSGAATRCGSAPARPTPTVERSAEVAAAVPLLARATPLIGHFQIRNRGTLGGSIAHADPAAEYPAVALALDAELEVLSPRGRAIVAAADFFTGVWTTALEADELLVGVVVPGVVGPVRLRRRGVRPPPRRLRHRRRRRRRRARRRRRRAALRHRADRAWLHAGAGAVGRGDGASAPAGRRRRRRRARAGRGRRRDRRARPTSTARPPTGGASAPRWSARAWTRAVEEARRWLRSRSRSASTASRGAPSVEPRLTLADFLRERCRLTGTHLGCEHGVCGACTVLARRRGRAVVPGVRRAGGRRARSRRSRGCRPDGGADRRPGGVPRLPRPPVRVLHAGVRRDAHRVPARPPRARRRRRSARRCRATCAAAPATRASSPPSTGSSSSAQ